MENLEKRIMSSNDFGLVKLLHEGLKEKVEEAMDSLENGNTVRFHELINISKDILTELLVVFSKEDELSTDLRRIYLFINKWLTKAEVSESKEYLEELIGVIDPLIEAFSDMESKELGRVVSGLTYGKNNLDEHEMKKGRTFEV